MRYIFGQEEKDDNISRVLSSLFILLLLFLPLNTFIRTSLQSFNYLIPLICLSFFLDFTRRNLIAYLNLPASFLLTLCTDFLSFPILYIYFGSPDLSSVLLSTSHTFSLMPDILACSFYVMYLLCQSLVKIDLNSQIDEVIMLMVIPMSFLMMKWAYVIIAVLIIGGIAIGKRVIPQKKQERSNKTDVLIENDLDEKLLNEKTSDHEK